MIPISPLTLVMGARSGIGKLVLDQLLAAGVRVRGSARQVSIDTFPAGVDAVRADLTDPASLGPAFAGVSQVFTYAVPSGLAGLAEAARASGVQRVVLMSSGSVLIPTSAANPITAEHRLVEQELRAAADLRLIPIRPLALATNALNWAREIKTTGAATLYQPDALTAPVHEADVAAVAVAALLEEGGRDPLISRVLTGPERMSQRAQVAAIGAALGREIAVHDQTRDQALARMSHVLPAVEADAICEFLDDAAAGNSPATRTVSQVLGRPAIDFDHWASDHVADFG